jgi:hypothetical protein
MHINTHIYTSGRNKGELAVVFNPPLARATYYVRISLLDLFCFMHERPARLSLFNFKNMVMSV